MTPASIVRPASPTATSGLGAPASSPSARPPRSHFSNSHFFDVVFSCLRPKIETLTSSSMSDVGLQVKGLPFNRYSWLTTHNSFALMGQKNALGQLPITATNQQDSITSQLQVISLSCLSLSLSLSIYPPFFPSPRLTWLAEMKGTQ